MTFRVGQKVCCINAGPSTRGLSGAPLVKGAVYTITDIVDAEDDGSTALMFAEIINESHDWYGYDPARFRPLVETKTDIGIFTAMLKPSKVDA